MKNEKLTPLPPEGFGKIKWHDLAKGLYYAVIGSVLTLLGFLVEGILTETPHLPTWVEILPYIKGVTATIGGYILGQFGINNVGQILKKNKEVVKIDVNTLEDLKEKASE